MNINSLILALYYRKLRVSQACCASEILYWMAILDGLDLNSESILDFIKVYGY